MDNSNGTNLAKWCAKSDWPVQPLILVRQLAVCMCIFCLVSRQPKLCSDWLDTHPNCIHGWEK